MIPSAGVGSFPSGPAHGTTPDTVTGSRFVRDIYDKVGAPKVRPPTYYVIATSLPRILNPRLLSPMAYYDVASPRYGRVVTVPLFLKFMLPLCLLCLLCLMCLLHPRPGSSECVRMVYL